MSTEVTERVVYVLTALAAVVVVVTRLRLGRDRRGAGRLQMGRGLVDVHTVVGVLALASWVAFLVAPEDSFLGSSTFGIISLACWWVTVVAGLMLLARWRRPRGRHADPGDDGPWWGPALSVLGHIGLLGGVCFFTWAYLFSRI
ncbi:hypothetical protein [Nocardioides sp. URHA0020]|uniref:hypothetical protein n=1 Tax=Nocardioides sp. URHA0020 TaxID=1380392 RepID=UPI000490C97D|nr:hypothetical protein [Nocardioides sp. URHA0020]